MKTKKIKEICEKEYCRLRHLTHYTYQCELEPAKEQCFNCIEIEGLKECGGHNFKPQNKPESSPSSDWEERFDLGIVEIADWFGTDPKVRKYIKSFIKSILQEREEEIAKQLSKYHKELPDYPNDDEWLEFADKIYDFLSRLRKDK